MSDQHKTGAVDWKTNGVKVIPGDQLDTNTPQTPGMNRAAAINFARVGAQKIWAGTVHIHANAKTGAHHHGALESVIYVMKGRARMRWGEHLEYVAEANPGDFIFIPPYVPHQEINASTDETLECVLVRSDNEAVVVNLDIEPVEKPEEVRWIDPIHKHGKKHPILGKQGLGSLTLRNFVGPFFCFFFQKKTAGRGLPLFPSRGPGRAEKNLGGAGLGRGRVLRGSTGG